ncbi:MAG: SH3 domain-containing protein [Clostridium sp.]
MAETIIKQYAESGVCYPRTSINVRTAPCATTGTVLAQYHKGESVNYDQVVITDKYVWISYVSYSGARRFMAVKDQITGERFADCGDNSGSTGGAESIIKEYAESSVCYPRTTINIRSKPCTTTGEVVGNYNKGESVNYDKVVITNKYVWISWIGGSGLRRYMAVKDQITGEIFGDCGEGSNGSGTPTGSEQIVKEYPESGECHPRTTINIRSIPCATTGTVVGQYHQGESVIYDYVVITNKYVWISWIGGSGLRRYMAVKDQITGERFGDCGDVGSGGVVDIPNGDGSTTSLEILKEAQKHVGVCQGSPQHKAIIDTYNSVKPLPRGYAVTYGDDWCDAFISFLAIKTGATGLIGRECGVDHHINIFKGLGIWNENGSITPKRGDIITFNWDDNSQPNDGSADHIGIVESVSNGKITTIEGNTKGGTSTSAVRRRTISVGYGNIRGYATPKYKTEDTAKPTVTEERIVVSGSELDLDLNGRRFKYNFIEPAIKKIRDIKQFESYDKITWLISRYRYSDTDLVNFEDSAKKLGVNIKFFDSVSELIEYINTGRSSVKITSFTVFAHGYPGWISLGAGSGLGSSLAFEMSDIKRLNRAAFDSVYTEFYSCRTAALHTPTSSESFADIWYKQVGGYVKAAVCRTDYAVIFGIGEEEITEHANQQSYKGYVEEGARNLPVLDMDETDPSKRVWKYLP